MFMSPVWFLVEEEIGSFLGMATGTGSIFAQNGVFRLYGYLIPLSEPIDDLSTVCFCLQAIEKQGEVASDLLDLIDEAGFFSYTFCSVFCDLS